MVRRAPAYGAAVSWWGPRASRRGGGGHVEAAFGGDLAVVMNGGPLLVGAAAAAVCLVDDHDRPGRQPALVVGAGDHLDRLVSGENDSQVVGGVQGIFEVGRVGGEGQLLTGRAHHG